MVVRHYVVSGIHYKVALYALGNNVVKVGNLG